MKRLIIVSVVLLLCGTFAFGQDSYLWPVEGKKAGDDILYKPQSYIGQELNASNLIIAAPLNTNILAPVDGTIVDFSYNYQSSLTYVTMFGKTPTDFRQDSLYFMEQGESDVQFFHLCVGIETADKSKVYVSGLRPCKTFKTGQKVQRGEVIGMAGYYYKKIDEPCVSIGISKKGVVADPMSPFGLKTTFQEPNMEQKTTLTQAEASEDFDIFVRALKEGFPGLYDYVSEADFERFTASKREEFGDTLSAFELAEALNTTIALIRDSHTALMNPPQNDNPRYSTIDFGIQGDSMIVIRTTLADKAYYGKRIQTVDGIPCDSMKALVEPYIHGSDGFVESYANFDYLCEIGLWYCYYIQPEPKYDLLIEFADGETKFFKGGKIGSGKCTTRTPSWRNWVLINQMEPVNFRMVSDTTAYLGIREFDLNQVEVEQIRAHFAQMVSDSVTNLIIDLRNNSGGNQDVMAEIYSFFAQKPFRQDMYQKVNKCGDFDFFHYSTNHGSKYCQKCAIDEHCEGEILFPDFELSPDGDGFFLDLSDQWHQPDSAVNYKGKVYLLVNERSFSASAVFAGWVKKQNRGVIVGRETGSSYHQMKAIKFENLMLPNSKFIVRFPLVKTVMDTVVNERFPYGRGVLPDYEVKFTVDELSFAHGDSILNYAQQLIREGKYIYYVEPEPETMTISEDTQKRFPWLWVVVGGAVFVGLVLQTTHRFKTSRQERRN